MLTDCNYPVIVIVRVNSVQAAGERVGFTHDSLSDPGCHSAFYKLMLKQAHRCQAITDCLNTGSNSARLSVIGACTNPPSHMKGGLGRYILGGARRDKRVGRLGSLPVRHLFILYSWLRCLSHVEQRRPPVVQMMRYSDVTRSLNSRLNLKTYVNVATIDKKKTLF